MDERIRLYKKEGREEGKEEGIIGSIEMLKKLKFPKSEIQKNVLEQYGDTTLTKKLLTQYNI